MDEYVKATDYDNLADAYERLWHVYQAERHLAYHRDKPREPQPKIVTRVQPQALDVAQEQHPL